MKKNINPKKVIKRNNRYRKIIFKFFFLICIIFYSLIDSYFTIIYKNYNINEFGNLNITQIIQNNVNFDNDTCLYIKNKLNERKQPFDYENELIFFICLISCKFPFSLIRFADGEEHIMRGQKVESIDKWHWSPNIKKFRESLIESASICKNNNSFIGIPCKNWIEYSRSIISFSKCYSSKYMSYSTLFVNKNYLLFKNWLLAFIKSSNRWKIILIANSIINKNISWAYKFFPVPDNIVEIWEEFSVSFLARLSDEAKKNNLIFFVSAGPAANIIITYLTKINNKNIYIDFGSSIEFITKGYSSRPYSKKNDYFSFKSCESFILRGKKIIYN